VQADKKGGQHYYKEEFPYKGSRELAEKVLGLLGEKGIEAEGVKRGLDHGVWVGFKCSTLPFIYFRRHTYIYLNLREKSFGLMFLTGSVPPREFPHYPYRPSLPLRLGVPYSALFPRASHLLAPLTRLPHNLLRYGSPQSS